MFGLFKDAMVWPGLVNIMNVLGVFFIVYGLIFAVFERYWGLPWFYSIDQHNGQINSFVEIFIGWMLLSRNTKEGAILAIILIALVILELKIVLSLLKNREEIFLGKNGIVTKKVHNKGRANIDGKEYKVFSENECILSGEKITVSKLRGGQLIVTAKN